MKTSNDRIEELLEELSQEVKNAQGCIMAVAIVPCSDKESTIIGRTYGNAGRIAVAILEGEKENEALQKIRDYYNIITNNLKNNRK